MPSDRSTHSISFSDELMREVETYCDQHDIKKCEFFEIAARDLLGHENAVPERLIDASKSPTERKLDEVLARLEGGAPLSSESEPVGYNNNSGGGVDAVSDGGSGATHPSSKSEQSGHNNNPGSGESAKPAVFDALAEDGRELSWGELKEVDEYVRSEDAWDELAIHPGRIAETKTRRDPVVTAAYGVVRWYVAEDERIGAWIADESATDAPDVRGVLRDVAPEGASEHALFKRSGAEYPSYYRELTEMLIPHATGEWWTTEAETLAEEVKPVLERDPDDLVGWALETDEGEYWGDVDSIETKMVDRGVIGIEDVGDTFNDPDDFHGHLREYIPIRMGVAWLDVAVEQDIGVGDYDGDDVRRQAAVYRHEARQSGGHQAVREGVTECIEDLEVAEDYDWE